MPTHQAGVAAVVAGAVADGVEEMAVAMVVTGGAMVEVVEVPATAEIHVVGVEDTVILQFLFKLGTYAR